MPKKTNYTAKYKNKNGWNNEFTVLYQSLHPYIVFLNILIKTKYNIKFLNSGEF